MLVPEWNLSQFSERQSGDLSFLYMSEKVERQEGCSEEGHGEWLPRIGLSGEVVQASPDCIPNVRIGNRG